LMPQVTPNRTVHGRQNVAFRGTRAAPFALAPAIEKANRRRKRKLTNESRRLLVEPDLLAAARGLVAVKRRWATIGSAGREYDGALNRSFTRVYEDIRARYAAEARAAHPLPRTPAPGTVEAGVDVHDARECGAAQSDLGPPAQAAPPARAEQPTPEHPSNNNYKGSNEQ